MRVSTTSTVADAQLGLWCIREPAPDPPFKAPQPLPDGRQARVVYDDVVGDVHK